MPLLLSMSDLCFKLLSLAAWYDDDFGMVFISQYFDVVDENAVEDDDVDIVGVVVVGIDVDE